MTRPPTARFDDHLVCQHGAYVLHADSFDGSSGNPLRVLSKKTITVRLQAFLDPASPSLQAADERRRAIEDNELELRAVEGGAVGVFNCPEIAEWHAGDEWEGHDLAAKVTKTQGECCALCAADANCAAAVWNAPGGKFGDSNCNMKWAAPPKPWKTNQKGEMGVILRPNLPHRPAPPAPPAPPLPASLDLSVKWMSGWGTGGPITPQSFTPIDPAVLAPTIVPEEETRVALQQNLTDGWGTWANRSVGLS